MTPKTIFKHYLDGLAAITQQGDAREESYYPALADMLGKMAEAAGQTDVHVTTLPAPTDGGNPDFRLWNGTDRIIGYIEAKRPTEIHLDVVEASEQLKRYRHTFPNLILTNFLEFRLYRDGDFVESALIGRPAVLNTLGKAPPPEKPDALKALLDRFFDFSLPKVFTAESLAVGLAKRTRMLREVVARQLLAEADAPGALGGFFEAFQTYLIGTLTPEAFADLFAQTITYGLFAARTRTPDERRFNRRVAFDRIPHTIGVLRQLFRFISLGDMPDELAWCVEDIAEVLAVADAPGILDRYFHEGKGSDPIVHFYETFLIHYDPQERERRGVYYTPEPVVGYIVRSLHDILKTQFGMADGLASEGVTLLDPAAGTMTFVARAARQAVDEFESKYGSGSREDFIRVHILKNFYAFELMMAPYAVGHLKMSFFLEELGHRLEDDERMPFFLTNTLDNEELEQSNLPGFSALAEESRLAGDVKHQTPILVVLGNPPYSGHSVNIGEWIRHLIDDYKQMDGKPLGERNIKWLQDDYVKFLRFAQWKIDQDGHGVVGMITNHSYLDNPTFRGMRRSLMRTFDEILVLDLHGNSLKKETTPEGLPDKNVFDIRQGVAIAFFIKRGPTTGNDAVVRHAELYGTRESKYEWLGMHGVSGTGWRELKPSAPSYLFVPRDNALEALYQRSPSIPEIFPTHSVGIVTARDKLTIQWSAHDVWKTVTVFSKMDPEMAREGYRLGKDVQDWKVSLAQKDLRDSGPSRDNVKSILYRPFDVRYTYYTGRSKGFICRPRPEVMGNMLSGENLAIITARTNKSPTMNHFFCSKQIVETKCGESTVQSYTFPLYLHPVTHKTEHFNVPTGLRPNLAPPFTQSLTQAYGEAPAPETIFHYIYAILYAPTYREKYAQFLRMDFPRVPFTSDVELFRTLAGLGEKLVGLHLLQSPDLDPPVCRFEGKGDSVVAKTRAKGFRYDLDEERFYINKTQYFEPVSRAAHEYQIGGYQVCEKWLKDRKERRLELDDIRTYCRIVTALKRTIDIQAEIDALYEDAEGDIVNLADVGG